jgi:hypothetical protein
METDVRTMAIILGAASGILSIPHAAQAAPGVGVQLLPTQNVLTEQIAYRRCWWAYGERHCRRVGDNRIYQYGAGSSDDYRVGTAEWYRAMEREGRLNRPRR